MSPAASAPEGRAALRRGLYLHVPFCSVKCFYCDFLAFSGQGAAAGRYLEALGRELSLLPRLPVSTLYVGGGTPSELSAVELDRLLGLAESYAGPLDGLLESTVEANPESLDAEKIGVLARRGVSRLSLGLQTADPALLHAVGRRHSVEDFVRAFRGARAAGLRVSVDLMNGLPGQTLDSALESLDFTLALEPEHLSLYGLSVEDRTLFAKRGVEVDEDLDREMYERSLERLEAAGYRHYEISNFARPGNESQHNRLYWEEGECVGAGCGASGYLGGTRYANKDRLADYWGALERGERPVAEQESLEGKRLLGERLLLGLRLLEGVTLDPETRAAFSDELGRLGSLGWLELEEDRARLTREGLFLANRVFEAFVAPFGSGQEASA